MYLHVQPKAVSYAFLRFEIFLKNPRTRDGRWDGGRGIESVDKQGQKLNLASEDSNSVFPCD